MSDNHCKDCCCAQSWEALNIASYTGKSIPDHIRLLRAELAEAREATDNYWYDRYRCVVDRAEQAETDRDRYREALERIDDDNDATDLEECKFIARKALKEGGDE